MISMLWLVSLVINAGLLNAGTLPASQINGLHALYNSTNGVFWNWAPAVTGARWFTNSAAVEPCADNWQGITCTANCSTASFCDIVSLKLSGYSLDGILPEQLSLLPALENLDLSLNPLLQGSIPSSLGDLVNLTSLFLSSAPYTGSFPSSLGNLTKLRTLRLVGTNCSGTIPNSYGSLRQMKVFDITINSQINGTFPSFISGFTNLSELYLMYNALSGTLPSFWGNLSSLKLLFVDANKFTGTIPGELGLLTALNALSLGDNPSMGGKIPDSLGGMSSLSFLSFQHMGLSGSIPTSLFSLVKVQNLYLSHNSLTSSLPSELCQLQDLYALYIENNLLSGPLPSPPWSKLLVVVDASNNHITGSIPESLFNSSLAQLTEVILSNNLLSGSIPSAVAGWQRMTYLDLGTNSLSSTLPSEFGLLQSLNTLLLPLNLFSGPLVGIVSNTMDALKTFDVNSNHFSGSVNLPLLASNVLNSFVVSKNCFSGTISDQVCQASQLEVLIMSGLTTGCAVSFKFLGYTDISANLLSGSIPACIFNMSSLVQLFMDGNGLSGPIRDISPTSQLRNLSLTYNRLTGHIPISIQQYSDFIVLDLSYNHLDGTIQYMNAFGSPEQHKSISLFSNRLTGLIPSSFTSTPVVINILNGNMFNCHLRKTLPQSDPVVGEYSCGSEKVSDPLYVTTVVLVVLLFGLAIPFWSSVFPLKARVALEYYFPVDSCASIVSAAKLFLFWNSESRAPHPVIDLFASLLAMWRRTVFISLAVVVVVLSPLYMSLKLAGDYGTHTYQYAWLPSIAFLQSGAPAITIALVWVTALVIIFVISSVYAIDPFVMQQMVQNNEERKRSLLVATNIRGQNLRAGILMALNAFVTLFMNGLFVLVTLYYDRTLQFLMVAFLIFFKLTWNFGFIIPAMNSLNCHFKVLTATLVFNVVIAPILAVLAADISCFQSLFLEPNDINIAFVYQQCDQSDPFGKNNGTCVNDIAVENLVAFTPPFVYSDQCGSALLTNYVPVFIATQGFVPFLGWIVAVLLVAVIFADKRKTDASQPGSGSTGDRVSTASVRERMLASLLAQDNAISKFAYRHFCGAIPLRSLEDLSNKRKSIRDNDDPSKCCLYDFKAYALASYLKMALMVSFGFAYPPLGVILGLNMVFCTLSLQLCLYYHHAQVLKIPGALKVWETIVSFELIDVHDIMMLSMRFFLVVLSFSFISIFVVDMSSVSNPLLPVKLLLSLSVILIILCACFFYLRRFRLELMRRLFSQAHIAEGRDGFTPAMSWYEMRQSSILSNEQSTTECEKSTLPVSSGQSCGEDMHNNAGGEEEEFNPIHG